MYDLQEEIRTSNERVVVSSSTSIEAEPSAYIFRRNFGTHLHLLGLDESEISYIIGHDIESSYETRNEFMDVSKRYRIKIKMEQRPLVNFRRNANRPKFIQPGQKYYVKTSQRLSVPTTAHRLHFQLSANEPDDPIRIQFKSKPESVRISKAGSYTADQYHIKSRHIILTQKHQELYD